MLVNAQVEKLFGYRREELLGEAAGVAGSGRVAAQASGTSRKVSLRSRGFGPWGRALELYGLHKDGHEFPVEISLSPLETEEGVLVSSAIRDITERKRLEKTILEISGREQTTYRTGLTRRLGPASDRHCLHEQSAGTKADRQEFCRKPTDAAKIVRLVNEAINKTRRIGARTCCRSSPTRRD